MRERERVKERESQTDRQTDRDEDRYREREKRNGGRDGGVRTRETERKRDKGTFIHTFTKIYIISSRQTKESSSDISLKKCSL